MVAVSWSRSVSKTISIDWDDTYTADPKLFQRMIAEMKSAGHCVGVVTRRHDTEQNRSEIATAEDWDFVVFAGDSNKRAAAESCGVSVDIWIDDNPATIDKPIIRTTSSLKSLRKARGL